MSLRVRKTIRVFIVVCAIAGLVACERTVVIAPDAVLPDGSKYLGDIKDNKFHGNGKLFFAGGGSYAGEFREGLYHGEGDLTVIGTRYQGRFNKGHATGKFKVYDAVNEQSYEGDLVDFVYQGQGRLESDNGVYVGEFEHYRYHGKGVLTTESGTYTGVFKSGSFTGKGRFKASDGSIKEGDFVDWLLHGRAKTVSSKGDVVEADFKEGYATGHGTFQNDTLGHYEGEFEYGQFQGKGKYTEADGSVYVGEFEYGQYHGEGTFTKATKALNGEPKVLIGKWHYGKYKGDKDQRTLAEQQSELALLNHQTLLNKRLLELDISADQAPSLYFFGMAGDGTQSVFRREVDLVKDFFAFNYGSEKRSVSLINDHYTAQTRPLATRLAFKQSINAIADVANLNADVLVVYISSHGSKMHSISVKHDTFELPDLDGPFLAEVLNNSGFRYKLIFISACYSGGYIPLLDDGNSLIITASSEIDTSFGCSDESELTYFGKALFRETLIEEPSLSIEVAFSKAKELIEKWEKVEELTASKPMIKKSAKVLKQLAIIRESQKP